MTPFRSDIELRLIDTDFLEMEEPEIESPMGAQNAEPRGTRHPAEWWVAGSVLHFLKGKEWRRSALHFLKGGGFRSSLSQKEGVGGGFRSSLSQREGVDGRGMLFSFSITKIVEVMLGWAPLFTFSYNAGRVRPVA